MKQRKALVTHSPLLLRPAVPSAQEHAWPALPPCLSIANLLPRIKSVSVSIMHVTSWGQAEATMLAKIKVEGGETFCYYF